MDDEANGFSKRKYENLNDKRRRMGDKKQKMLRNKKIAKNAKFGSKPGAKKSKKWHIYIYIQNAIN